MWRLPLTLCYLGGLILWGKGMMKLGDFRRMENDIQRSVEEDVQTGKRILFQRTAMIRYMVFT